MSHGLIDPYHRVPGPLHRLGAGLKSAVALAFVVTIVALPRQAWAGYALAAGALLVLGALSRVPARDLVRRVLLLEPFALGVALLALLQPHGARAFAAALTRSTLCLSAMVLLAATTRFSDVLRVLWRLRVPALLVTTLALMHRYLFVLVDEAVRMARARRSRTYAAGRLTTWRASANVIAHLFVRGSERAERIYAAMCARGWKT